MQKTIPPASSKPKLTEAAWQQLVASRGRVRELPVSSKVPRRYTFVPAKRTAFPKLPKTGKLAAGTTARHFAKVLHDWAGRLKHYRHNEQQALYAMRSVHAVPKRAQSDMLQALLWGDAQDHNGCRCESCTWDRLRDLLWAARSQSTRDLRKKVDRDQGIQGHATIHDRVRHEDGRDAVRG